MKMQKINVCATAVTVCLLLMLSTTFLRAQEDNCERTGQTVACLQVSQPAILPGEFSAPRDIPPSSGNVRVIIVLEEPAVLAPQNLQTFLREREAYVQMQSARIERAQDALLHLLTASNFYAALVSRTDYVINSLVVEVDRDSISLIQALPGVQAVYPVQVVNPDIPPPAVSPDVNAPL